jgi:hypothetical protein
MLNFAVPASEAEIELEGETRHFLEGDGITWALPKRSRKGVVDERRLHGMSICT